MHIGNGIKIALLEEGKTQKWLSQKLGVTKQTVNGWCNHPEPSLRVLERIAKALEVKLSHIVLLGEGYEKKYTETPVKIMGARSLRDTGKRRNAESGRFERSEQSQE